LYHWYKAKMREWMNKTLAAQLSARADGADE